MKGDILWAISGLRRRLWEKKVTALAIASTMPSSIFGFEGDGNKFIAIIFIADGSLDAFGDKRDNFDGALSRWFDGAYNGEACVYW
jgi:hypothetical protein